MYKLYSRPMSGGFVVEAALTLAGAPFEVVHVERKAPPAGYSDLSPFDKVPALGLPDGTTMTESAAICLLLAERFPDAGLGPAPGSPERPAFLRWMLFLATMLYPTLMQFYFAKRSTTDLGGDRRGQAGGDPRGRPWFRDPRRGTCAAAMAGRRPTGQSPTSIC